jgi:hypothetical protein
MPDDWRKRWRSWSHPHTYAHPDSPAGGSGPGFSRSPGSAEHSWFPLPHPDSPAGRYIHWQTEFWALEQRERDEIARHAEELETSLARHSDKLRESIPDGHLRTLYDRQVGRTKGTCDFAKSLISTGVDATLLLQKLTNPVGWLDQDLHRKLHQGYSFGAAVSRGYAKWEFGTLQEKKQVLQQVGALAEHVYQEARNSIQRQWAEAKRAGKQEELIERWKTRLLLEVGALAIGAGELKATGSAAEGLEATSDASRTIRAAEDVVQAPKSVEESTVREITETNPVSSHPAPAVVDPIAERQTANDALRKSPHFENDLSKANVSQQQLKWMNKQEAPLGFESPQQFQSFKQELTQALRQDGLDDAQVGMKGTATTFYSENPKKPVGHFWDADPSHPGDYDLNLSSTKMAQQMQEAGINVNPKYGVYRTADINSQFPAVSDFSAKWSTILERDVNVVGYSAGTLPARDATEFILVK